MTNKRNFSEVREEFDIFIESIFGVKNLPGVVLVEEKKQLKEVLKNKNLSTRQISSITRSLNKNPFKNSFCFINKKTDDVFIFILRDRCFKTSLHQSTEELSIIQSTTIYELAKLVHLFVKKTRVWNDFVNNLRYSNKKEKLNYANDRLKNKIFVAEIFESLFLDNRLVFSEKNKKELPSLENIENNIISQKEYSAFKYFWRVLLSITQKENGFSLVNNDNIEVIKEEIDTFWRIVRRNQLGIISATLMLGGFGLSKAEVLLLNSYLRPWGCKVTFIKNNKIKIER